MDHSNLYQYVFNNPFRFQDPNGENVIGYLFGIGQIIAGGAIMASGVALEVASFGSYTFAFGVHEAARFGLMASGYATATYHAQDISIPSITWKSRGSNVVALSQNFSNSLGNSKDNNKRGGHSHNDNNEKKSPGHFQKQSEQKKAPRSIDRADRGRGEYEIDHVHFKDGSALNYDGTWKHGNKELTRQESGWLVENGWKSP